MISSEDSYESQYPLMGIEYPGVHGKTRYRAVVVAVVVVVVVYWL